MVAGYAGARLGPALDRIGWTAKPGEASNDAILRGELIAMLGGVGDPRVVAVARRLDESPDRLATEGGLRGTILGVVAGNVDAAGWDRLRAQAKAEKNPLVRAQLYRALGAAKDPALAPRALDLALTDEPGATTGSAIVAAVAQRHPDLAFDFATGHREQVEALVDESARTRFIPGLAATSANPETVAKLRLFAERYMTPQSRRPADISIASIEDRLRIRHSQLDQASRWFEAHSR
jgi:aminopeptidase N